MSEVKITKPLRLIELFAGIGAQAKALERLDELGYIPNGFEHYKICEFDKYAVKSYNAVHGTDFGVSDITQLHAQDLGIVDTDKYTYLLTYSFPCQDLSLAGLQRGMEKGSGTRSGLLWEVERLLEECYIDTGDLPQLLLMENVPQVHGKKNLDSWTQWLDKLDELGYKSAWTDLNAKDFGIPQNRKRCFCLSWLPEMGDTFTFPEPFELKLRLKDMLEDTVDEKYYLSDDVVEKMLEQMSPDAIP